MMGAQDVEGSTGVGGDGAQGCVEMMGTRVCGDGGTEVCGDWAQRCVVIGHRGVW